MSEAEAAEVEEALEAAEESSFAELLSEFEEQHQSGDNRRGETLEGIVIDVTPNSVFVDIGMKREGMLPREEVLDQDGEPSVKAGDKIVVSVAGRSQDGYFRLSTVKVARPKDWSSLEKAYAEGQPISAVVSEVIKGGLSVDVGARAFMPASRSGARDAADLEALVGQEIRCKVIQLDTAKEDIVVDRRAVLEAEAVAAKAERFAQLQEGEVLSGKVRSLTDFGAFVDLGGIDGLLHVTDIAWNRVKKPSDVLSEGETVEVKILKIDPAKGRVSLGRKQLIPDPWSLVEEKYQAGQKVRGTVVRLTDFGAFVEIEPGIDGMIHVSEMSWTKKVRKPADVLKKGEVVDVVVLSASAAQHRIALGLKQALGDPWEDIEKKYPAGAVLEVKITNMAKFGAFAEIEEGIEGMIHVADITHEKRLDHPNEELKEGQTVKVTVLEIDRSRKRIRLGMKQLIPTSSDEYIAEHKVDDVVTGRIVDVKKNVVRVDLGDGVMGHCRKSAKKQESAEKKRDEGKPDLSAMTAMLAAKWKEGGASPSVEGGGALQPGQVRSFRIVSLDAQQKKIELELGE